MYAATEGLNMKWGGNTALLLATAWVEGSNASINWNNTLKAG